MVASVSEIIDGLLEDAETALAAGTTSKALAIYRGILMHDSDHVLALRQAGAIMLHQDNPMAAMELFQRAVQLSPSDPDLYHGFATSLRLVGHADDAMRTLQAVLKVDETHAPALHDLALLYLQKDNLAEAEMLFRKAAAYGVGRGRFEAELQRAVVLFRQDRLPEAERWFHRAGLLNPSDPRPFMNVAMIYRTWGHLDAAVKWLEKAVEVAPDNPDAHWNLANALLVRGDLERGWAEYEWRFRRAGRGERTIPIARWAGENLAGKTLLLSAEQGMGDVIQFIRFAQLFAERGAKVIVECHAGLEHVLATAPGVAQVMVLGSTLPLADFYLPIMSAPQALGVTLATLPSPSAYLFFPPLTPTATLPGRSLRIGLVWRGNPMHENDHFRSLPLAAFEPILRIVGATFISLQVGESRSEIASLPPGLVVHDVGGQLTDFALTANAISQLDLVITVDTAVAHLAGAMGIPVWLLIARGNDWRWLHARTDSPWYPSMRLFRQAPHRDWAVPVRQIAAALAQQIG